MEFPRYPFFARRIAKQHLSEIARETQQSFNLCFLFTIRQVRQPRSWQRKYQEPFTAPYAGASVLTALFAGTFHRISVLTD